MVDVNEAMAVLVLNKVLLSLDRKKVVVVDFFMVNKRKIGRSISIYLTTSSMENKRIFDVNNRQHHAVTLWVNGCSKSILLFYSNQGIIYI